MRIKAGVRVLGLRPEMAVAIIVAREVFAQHKVELVITSIIEGTHERASLHYTGCAADLRRPTSQPDAEAVVRDLRDALGDDYDVILEGDHIHVEFQPKQPY